MSTTGHGQPNHAAQTMARALGVFSIALGATEILFPNAVKRSTGAPGPEGLYSAYGWREVVTGALILASKTPAAMVWLRVAGDALDLATIAPAAGRSNPHRNVAKGALGFLVGATLLDLLVAAQGDYKPAPKPAQAKILPPDHPIPIPPQPASYEAAQHL
jgi:hypothetical protein